MSAKAASVVEYINGLEPKRKAALGAVREVILKSVPGVDETMLYGMPTYELGDDVVCAMASQKNYMSLYMNVDLVEKHREELGDLNIGKSCVRFRRLEKLPLDVVATILKETVALPQG